MQAATERSHCRFHFFVALPCHCGWHRGTTGLLVTPWILPVPFPVVGTCKPSVRLVRLVEVLRSNWSAGGQERGCWSQSGRGRETRRTVQPGMCLAAHEGKEQGGKTRNWREDKIQFQFQKQGHLHNTTLLEEALNYFPQVVWARYTSSTIHCGYAKKTEKWLNQKYIVFRGKSRFNNFIWI